LRLSLLRSPEYPDPHADEGEHDFTYSLYPHGGNWREGFSVRRGYELNYKLISIQTQEHTGALPPEHSFVQLEPSNLILTAMKQAEDGSGLVLRFYEWAGKEVEAKLDLAAKTESASETDLMEREIRPLQLSNSEITAHTGPYEIKTIKVRFASQQGAETAASAN